MNFNQFREQKVSDRARFQAYALHALISKYEISQLDANKIAGMATAITDATIKNQSPHLRAINARLKESARSKPGLLRVSDIFPEEYWNSLHWCQIAAWAELCCYCLRRRKQINKGIHECGVYGLIKPDNVKSDIEFQKSLDVMTTFDDVEFLDLAQSAILTLGDISPLISDESAIDEV